jgi:hypothetical protein
MCNELRQLQGFSIVHIDIRSSVTDLSRNSARILAALINHIRGPKVDDICHV